MAASGAQPATAVLELSDRRQGSNEATRVDIVEPSHELTAAQSNDAAAASGHFLWSRSMLRRLRGDGDAAARSEHGILASMTPKVKSFYVQQEQLLDAFSRVERLEDATDTDSERELLVTDDRDPSAGNGEHSATGGRDHSSQPNDASLQEVGTSGLTSDQFAAARSRRRQRRHRSSMFQLSVKQATHLSMAVNVLLFVLKLVALILSGSLSVLSSVVDSALDLFTGVVLFVTQRLLRPKKSDVYRYPAGKQRIEPVAIIICACVMATAALQLITQSVQSIAKGDANPKVDALAGTILGMSVVLKLILFLLCRGIDNPSVQALALDHRNDTVSNLVAIAFGLLGTYVRGWIDPLGSMLIAVYIIVNWVKAGKEQVQLLIGIAADPNVLQQLTYAALKHSQSVLEIDTVRAFHFGTNYIVEVHVVLPATMALKDAHDIGESLQMKLEKLEHVERAFVHLDFESRHHPSAEHRPLHS